MSLMGCLDFVIRDSEIVTTSKSISVDLRTGFELSIENYFAVF